MPQLRKDPVIERWVIIATERAKRPQDFGVTEQKEELPGGKCPFCHGREDDTPPEIYSLRPQDDKSRWEVRVVPSIVPMLKIEGELDRHGVGLYDAANGIGAHEIIVETPRHIARISDLSAGEIEKVINTYVIRIKDLQNDKRFKYVLVFKNYGWLAGGSRINHSRSQLIATPVNPKRVKEELDGAREYFSRRKRCIYCDIIKQELKDKKRLVAESDGFAAFEPFASRFPFETWVLPKRHCSDFHRMEQNEPAELAAMLKSVFGKLTKALNDPPYNYVIHTAPFKNAAKEGYYTTIDSDYHWHMEIMPRLTRVAGFEWGTGFYINPTPPEDAAGFLKNV